MQGTSSRIIFLDWDGTLSSGRFWSSLDEADSNLIQDNLFIGNQSLVREWMMGKVTSEDVCLWLSLQTGLEYDRLFKTLVADCGTMKIDPPTKNVLAQFSTGVKLILITDNMDCFTRFTIPTTNLNEIFHDIFNSSDIGRLKKEGRGKTFLDAAKKHETQIEDCILIDDSSKTCELFRSLGGTTHLTVNPQNTFEILTSKIIRTIPDEKHC